MGHMGAWQPYFGNNLAQMVEVARGFFDFTSRDRWTAQQRLRYGVELIGGTRKAAKEADIPLSSLSRYLSGQSKVPLSVLRQVAIAAGYSPDYLIAGMSEQPAPEPENELIQVTLSLPVSALVSLLRQATAAITPEIRDAIITALQAPPPPASSAPERPPPRPPDEE